MPRSPRDTARTRGDGSGGPRFAVVGNPDNRRVTLFAGAVRGAGLPAPRVVPWTDVLRGGEGAPQNGAPQNGALQDGALQNGALRDRAAFRPGETVRLDSPGEDADVARMLRGTGDGTRVEGSGVWYERFTRAAAGVLRAAAGAGAAVLDDPDELAVLFDKRLCHGVLTAAGVPVPPSPTSGPGGCPVRGWDGLRALLADAGLHRVFVKPAHGSSASGVIALELGGPGRVHAVTSVERAADGRLFNSLRVRAYRDEREVAAIVDALAPDGLHVERWLPKAGLEGRAADLRVVVVGGRATHAVVRTSRSPMTNLHLGGARGDLSAVRAAAGAAGVAWADVLGVCERAAACFPGTLCVGVDLLPAIGWRRFAVGEVNAFGDLLPGLTGLPGSGAEGLDTYGAQVAAVLRGEGWRRGEV